MKMLGRCASMLAIAAAATAFGPQPARAEIKRPVKIVVMNDQNSINAAGSGLGSLAAAKLAAAEFGNKINGVPIEVVGMDHQNKPDIASALARQGYDVDGVDAMVDFANSAVSAAVQEIGRERGKVVLHVGTGLADLYGKSCSPTSAMWYYDTYMLAQGLARAIIEDGGKNWFFLSADYAFGKAMTAETTKVIDRFGGKLLGEVRHPLGSTDFSSYLLQAQGANPDIIGLASGGDDPTNIMKQAAEFGIDRRKTKFALFVYLTNYVQSLGPKNAEGLQYLAGFFWDRDDATRALTRKISEVMNGKLPTEIQVANYSAVRHYLRAVQAADSTDGLVVMRKMKELPVDDAYAPGARIRQDGRLINDWYLVEAKGPDGVKGPWDLLRVRRTVKGQDIIRPVSEGGCTRLDGPA